MRETEHMKRHLFIVTEVDFETISTVPVEDPFHTTNVIIRPTFREWLKLLFKKDREIKVRVKVRSDGVSQGRWFQGRDICEKCKRVRLDGHDSKPGYEHGDERWCHDCYYGEPITPLPSEAFTAEGLIRERLLKEAKEGLQ